MKTSKIITLTTDFGQRDSFVGQMKGAALSVDPEARLVDLCHGVPPHDVRAGSYLLETGYNAFPDGTVHVVVVDPGVGTDRRLVAVHAGRHLFLAPDNGVLSRVLAREKIVAAHLLQNPTLYRSPVTPTFEGRDVLAPVAAWITRGVELQRLGPPAGQLVTLEPTGPRVVPGRPCRVAVVHVDHFGSVVLDMTATQLTALLGHAPDRDSPLTLRCEGGIVSRFVRTYGEADGVEPFFLINSTGYLEIACRAGRADERLALRAGVHPELTVGD
ncbi:MAG TPA: SAM-dependent chlorinase/fluorinase [Candidatus Polarisedimenticolaceae bacterium]|nr:SAM-dependent chlorinase/fluorinase [Candidatus Polarisedimenticolaceae bacterium]